MNDKSKKGMDNMRTDTDGTNILKTQESNGPAQYED